MDVIKGETLQIAGAVYVYQLDGKGGVTGITNDTIASAENPCWLHLDYTQPQCNEWLRNTPLLPETVREGLAGESVRPKVLRLGDGTMITLRGINFSSDGRPNQLVTLRIYITDKLMVSTHHRKVHSIDTVLSDLKNGVGACDSGMWLVEIADGLTNHLGEFVEELHDKIIDMEDALLQQKVPARGQMLLLRKQLIVLRRYMAPQRDVFARLASERLIWMGDIDRRRMQEISERLGRELEDLDANIARTGILADEISSLMAETTNRRTYTMSLLAMTFLPMTFLTGLFGVNLGGIPGNEYRLGFSVFCLVLILLVIGVAWCLKHSKWL